MLGLFLIWKAHRIGVVCFLLVAVLDAVAIPATAAAVKNLTNAVTRGDARDVLSSSGVYMAVIVSAALPFMMLTYVTAIILAQGLVRLQTKISERMIYMEFNESSKFSHEDCQDVFRSDIARMEKLMNMMLKQLLAPFMKLAIALCYVTYVRAEVGFLAMTIFPFIFITVPDSRRGAEIHEFMNHSLCEFLASFRSKKASTAFKDATSKVAAVFSNALSCHSMIWHTDAQQAWMKDILLPHTSEVRRSKRRVEFWSGVVGGYITQMLQLFVALHIVILANMAVQGTLTVGDFTGIVALFTQLASPTTKLGAFVKEITKLSGATQSVAEFLATKNEQPKGLLWDWQRNLSRNVMGAVLLTSPHMPEQGEAEVSVVPVAPGFCHRIQPGSLVSFTSEEGGPVPEFLKLFNGYGSHGLCLRPENYKGPTWTAVQRLKSRTAVLSKAPSILTGSVRDNICFGAAQISEERLLQAARLAGLNLDEYCSEGSDRSGGSDGPCCLNFSTQLGERCVLDPELAQRICLARAIYSRPSLLLLDQATAGWAPEMEAKFFNTLLAVQQTEDFANMSVINNSSHMTQAMVDAGFAETVFKMKDGHLEVGDCGRTV